MSVPDAAARGRSPEMQVLSGCHGSVTSGTGLRSALDELIAD
jgi:hypothetical protein